MLDTPNLASIVRHRAPRPEPEDGERCDLCARPLSDRHRHLLEVERRRLLCACDACRVLFDRAGAGGGRYRLVPERRLRLDGTVIDDTLWESLEIPVGIALLFRQSAAGRPVALYPGPMGAVESLFALDAFGELEEALPALRELEIDVEGLLVHRIEGARDAFLVPIDDGYRLVASMRRRWKGLTGGGEERAEVARFLEDLAWRSAPAGVKMTAPERMAE